VRNAVIDISQASRKKSKMALLIPTSTPCSLSSETPADVAMKLMKKRALQHETKLRKENHSWSIMEKATQPPWQQMAMSEETADRIITAHVEASLTRFEPPDRISDPSVQNALVAAYGTGILQYIPTPNTIFDRYVTQP
jgi:hypothetical protein